MGSETLRKRFLYIRNIILIILITILNISNVVGENHVIFESPSDFVSNWTEDLESIEVITTDTTTTAPNISIDSPTATTYGTDTVTVTLSGDAANYWYYIQGEDGSNQTWSANIDRTISDGTYTLHAYGNDSVGNETHVSVTFTVDTIAPTVNNLVVNLQTTIEDGPETKSGSRFYYHQVQSSDDQYHYFAISVGSNITVYRLSKDDDNGFEKLASKNSGVNFPFETTLSYRNSTDELYIFWFDGEGSIVIQIV